MEYFRALTFQQWLFFYMTTGDWGHGINKFDPAGVLYGYTSSYLAPPSKDYFYIQKAYPFRYNLSEPGIENRVSFTHNQVAYFTLFLLIGTLLFLPWMWMRYGRTLFFMMMTGGIFTALSVYWEPYYFEFWMVPNMFYMLWAVLLLNVIGEKLSPLLKKLSQIPGYAYAVFFLLVMASYNFTTFTVPFTKDFQIHGIPLWARDNNYWKKFLNDSVYKNPKNPYQGIYPGGK